MLFQFILYNCYVKNVGPIYLISNMETILEELESHQVALQALQADSGIGTFMDDVFHWQKTLQMVEVLLHLWAEVQERWIELEEVWRSQVDLVDLLLIYILDLSDTNILFIYVFIYLFVYSVSSVTKWWSS